MPRALDVRTPTVLMLALALCAALLALAPTGPAHAQTPAAVVDAATADLAERLDVDPGGLELLRSEAVTWSDYCLGVYEPDIACATALVDGFALWLSDGAVAYRYHTDGTGAALRLAESGIALDEVAGAPLPEGRAAPPPDDEPAPPPDDEPTVVDDEPAPVDDAASPAALPASGSGGLADDTDAPAWVWAVIAAIALSAIGTGGAYRFWLRSRRR